MVYAENNGGVIIDILLYLFLMGKQSFSGGKNEYLLALAEGCYFFYRLAVVDVVLLIIKVQLGDKLLIVKVLFIGGQSFDYGADITNAEGLLIHQV